MSKKPAVALVHGFWGNAGHRAKVIVELNTRGYTSLHVVENPLTSLADDAERTRKLEFDQPAKARDRQRYRSPSIASISRCSTCLVSRRVRFGSSAVAMTMAASSSAPISTCASGRTGWRAN